MGGNTFVVRSLKTHSGFAHDRKHPGHTLSRMTSDPKVAAVVSRGCPKCESLNITPTLHDSVDCINREDHVHMVCHNPDCLNGWNADLV